MLFLLALLGVAFAKVEKINMNFMDFKKQFEKDYLDETEHNMREEIFMANLKIINKHNSEYLKGEHTWFMGVNQFTDMTGKEFKQFVSRPFNRTRPSNVLKLDESTMVDAIDWVDRGAVTPVKNQGQCGSCWAFSTTGSTEGRDFIKNGASLQSLSEQQLVDCDRSHDNGCNGGLMDYAFDYIHQNGGIDSEADYSYTAHRSTCNTAKAARHVVAVDSHADVAEGSATQMQTAVSAGPVSIAIEADQYGFQHYNGGVFTGTCGTQLDHGVLIVGFAADYWKVKNSWGATWGEEGYIRMGRTKDSSNGQCGLLKSGSYPMAGARPSPGPGPSPGPTPGPGPSGDHYADPYTGMCAGGDVNVTISGVQGAFCAPSCTSGDCPGAPSGFDAEAQCALQDQSGDKLCALICNPGDSSACDASADATCKSIQGTGICTYNQGGPGPGPTPGCNPTHYEKPSASGECSGSEKAIQIQGLAGNFCSPKCVLGIICPQPDTDCFTGARSQCALQDQSGDKYCALICDPSDSTSCDTADGMTCKSIQGTGICTYGDEHFKWILANFKLNLEE